MIVRTAKLCRTMNRPECASNDIAPFAADEPLVSISDDSNDDIAELDDDALSLLEGDGAYVAVCRR